MYNNKFEENAAHSQGVLAIFRLQNVEISNDNVFASNSD